MGSTSQTVLYVTPSLLFEQTGSDRILGQTYQLEWRTYADSCVPSGGAPGDGWASTAIFNIGNATPIPFTPNVTTLGTYTYTLTCSSGPLSVQQSVTATFEQNAPYVTASISPTTVTYSGDSPADYVTVTWNSNMSTCIPNVELALTDPLDIPYQAQGSGTFDPTGAGSVPISVRCALPGSQPTFVTSTPLTLTVLPPPAPTETVSINPTTVVEGQAFTVTWSSTNSTYCAGSGGMPDVNIGWDTYGTFALSPAGTFSYTPGGAAEVGKFTFGLTCESIDSSVVAPTSTQALLTVQALTSTLTTSASSVTVGDSFTLTWSSQGATSCTASGGGADGSPWSGSVATSGTTTQTGTTSGTFTYTLNCGANGVAATPEQVVIKVSAASGSSSSGSTSGGAASSGHSGGGSLDPLELILLAALGGLRGFINMRRRKLPGADQDGARRDDVLR
jgi:hypothetical protein